MAVLLRKVLNNKSIIEKREMKEAIILLVKKFRSPQNKEKLKLTNFSKF